MRQALLGVRCLLAVVLLMVAVPGLGNDALAATIQVVNHPVIACVDPRALLALTRKSALERHSARWRAKVARRGRCFAVQPGERWEQIDSVRGMLLMRKTPPQPGLPPLYFRADSLAATSDDSGGAERASAGAIDTPVLQSPEQAARSPVQPPGGARPGILTQSLPPPAAVSFPPAAAMPANSAIPSEAAIGPDVLPPDTSVAAERGYAIGFGIAILLIVVLLTGFALLLRELLRRPPDPLPAAPNDKPPAAEPEPVLAVTPRPAPNAPVPLRPALAPARRPAPDPVAVLETAGNRRGPDWAPEEEEDEQAEEQVRCAAVLRAAGWNATVRFGPDRPCADVVAWRDGRVLALRCLPDNAPVDEQAVEDACLARERERADVAAILSNAPFTPAARQLASQAGIDLLHEDELRAFAE